MPARKTIAERRAEVMGQRQRTIALILGAIPVVILVIVIGVFVYQRATELGSDELPASISTDDRSDIQSAIRDFYSLVNGYQVEPLVDTIVWDGGGRPIREIDRLILELSGVLGEQLTVEMQNLGATSIVGDKVLARAVTNFGTKDVFLKRRDGAWHVAQPVDIAAPQELGPLALELNVLNTYHSDSGEALYVTGTMKNTGDRLGFVVSVSGYAANADGKTLSTSTQPPPGSPFLQPGEETYFQLAFGRPPEDDTPLDPSAVVILPDFRPSNPVDISVVSNAVSVEPGELSWQPGTGGQVTVISTDRSPVETRVFAILRDSSLGTFLSTWALYAGTIAPGGQQLVDLPTELPSALADATATLSIVVYGAVRS